MNTSDHSSKVVIQHRLKLDSNGFDGLRILEQEIIKTPPIDCLLLDIYPSDYPHSDLALAICEVLARRAPETLFLARAMGSLGPCESLIFLAADERDCLPSIGLALPGKFVSANAQDSDFSSKASAIALEDVGKPAPPTNCRELIERHQHYRLMEKLSEYVELTETEQFITAEELHALGWVGNGYRDLFGQIDQKMEALENSDPPSQGEAADTSGI